MTGWQQGSTGGFGRRLFAAAALSIWAGTAGAECLAFGRDVARVWSETALKNRITEHLNANTRRFGEIDWPCLTHAFRVLSSTTSVETGRSAAGGTLYRFTVDRSRNPLAVLGSAGGGAPNGVFVAEVRVSRDGRLGVVQ